MLIRSFSSVIIQICGKMMTLAFYLLELPYFVLHCLLKVLITMKPVYNI